MDFDLTAERIKNLGAHPVDIASAERCDYVAPARARRDPVRRILLRAKVVDLDTPSRAQRIVKPARGDIGDRLFACGIDLKQVENIGVIESRKKIVEEIAEPGVPMRLKDCDYAPLERRANRGERRADFGRMMRIVVEHDTPGGFALDLEAPADSATLGHRGRG